MRKSSLRNNIGAGLKKMKNLGQVEEEKVFKIRYTCNLLPSVDETGQFGTVINAMVDTDEIACLLHEATQSMVDFKWERFARRQQLIGFMCHVGYQIMLFFYINNVYLNHNLDIDPKTGKEIYKPNIPMLWVMGTFLLYPVYNDGN